VRSRSLVLLIAPLLLAQALLPALAWASAPDPSWVSGVYDDADYDDVVVLVTSASGAPAASPPDARPGLPLLGIVAEPGHPATLLVSRSTVHSRAPPIA
jgi:hypothetical protein